MDNQVIIEKFRKKLATAIILEIVFIALMSLDLIAWLVICMLPALSDFMEMYTYIFILVFVVLIIAFAFLYNTVDRLKKEYQNLYHEIVVKKALFNENDVTVRFTENSFSDEQKIKMTGFSPVGDEVDVCNYFSGSYRNVSFEGAYVDSYNYNSRDNNLLRDGKTHVYTGIVGEITNVNYTGNPIVIYSKGYRNKRFIYQIADDVEMIVNKEFSRNFIVKCLTPESVMDFLTAETMNALLEVLSLVKQIGLHCYAGKISFSVKAMDLGMSPSIWKKMDIDAEIMMVREKAQVYFNFLSTIGKQDSVL